MHKDFDNKLVKHLKAKSSEFYQGMSNAIKNDKNFYSYAAFCCVFPMFRKKLKERLEETKKGEWKYVDEGLALLHEYNILPGAELFKYRVAKNFYNISSLEGDCSFKYEYLPPSPHVQKKIQLHLEEAVAKREELESMIALANLPCSGNLAFSMHKEWGSSADFVKGVMKNNYNRDNKKLAESMLTSPVHSESAKEYLEEWKNKQTKGELKLCE